MKFLIHINTDSELISYEALALGFVLASFDHHVQLYLHPKTKKLLGDPDSRFFGMIQSLSLYDIEPAWANFDIDDLSGEFDDVVTTTKTLPNTDEFDTVLNF